MKISGGHTATYNDIFAEHGPAALARIPTVLQVLVFCWRSWQKAQLVLDHLRLVPLTAAAAGVHSWWHLQEMNDHDESCRFIQVWIMPNKSAPGYGTPKYGSTRYTKEDRHNQLLNILSGTGLSPAWPRVSSKGVIQLHQDGNVFVSESDAGQEYELQLAARRQAYILCMEGGGGGAEGLSCVCACVQLAEYTG